MVPLTFGSAVCLAALVALAGSMWRRAAVGERLLVRPRGRAGPAVVRGPGWVRVRPWRERADRISLASTDVPLAAHAQAPTGEHVVLLGTLRLRVGDPALLRDPSNPVGAFAEVAEEEVVAVLGGTDRDLLLQRPAELLGLIEGRLARTGPVHGFRVEGLLDAEVDLRLAVRS